MQIEDSGQCLLQCDTQQRIDDDDDGGEEDGGEKGGNDDVGSELLSSDSEAQSWKGPSPGPSNPCDLHKDTKRQDLTLAKLGKLRLRKRRCLPKVSQTKK